MSKLKSGDRVRVYGYSEIVKAGQYPECWKPGQHPYGSGHHAKVVAIEDDLVTVKYLSRDLPGFRKIRGELYQRSLCAKATVQCNIRQVQKVRK